ncbi:hypothetical protein VCRA2119O147_1240011 [Vibrio crassostreae]|nr:hypothetical protein VCRA2112O187_3510001 [Vibrio crassostreae]CAK2138452.1 hypothetical protein VCRA2113O119_510007 [Vibrio crassostreae]CAK2170473.1 hypothetical protein VCRA2116O234_50010 [Vibrio crassostreae]CAK2207406.1 hypothetical protein VCRA2116O233_60010 [Vibrio crassostreae]CAK2218722.1 hypothetical protein VCRA2118O236_70001 [Vibrio crassostreae]
MNDQMRRKLSNTWVSEQIKGQIQLFTKISRPDLLICRIVEWLFYIKLDIDLSV